MKEVVIVSGVRTPIATFGGSLKDVPVVKLGAIALKGVMKKAGLKPVVTKETMDCGPEKLKGQGLIELEKKAMDWDDSAIPVPVDEVIMGNVLRLARGKTLAARRRFMPGFPKKSLQ